MKKLFTLFCLLFFTSFCFGQDAIELSKEYFLDFKNIDHFKKGSEQLQVKERVNYDLYLQVKEAFKYSKGPEGLDLKKAFEMTPFKAEKAEYIVNNEYQQFHFNLDENSLLSGNATLVQSEYRDQYYWNFNFDAGKLKNAEVKLDPLGNTIRRVDINDSIFMVQFFNKNTGNPTGKRVIKNYKDPANSIDITYDKEGSIVEENNKQLKTKKTFYPNGNSKTYENALTQENIKYDDMGRITQHYYIVDDKEGHLETYQQGVILSKKSRSLDGSELTEYYYKDGNLEGYKVVDFVNDQTRTYDKNKKLLSTETNVYKN
ncbi:hypothetical protein ACYSNM_09435 [Myroides sp. LJL116]